MWLRHFLRKRRQKTFRQFKKRYYEFRNEDCVDICEQHHTEIHTLYFARISRVVRLRGHVPCSRWTWEQANALMAELRTLCNEWLAKPSTF